MCNSQHTSNVIKDKKILPITYKFFRNEVPWTSDGRRGPIPEDECDGNNQDGCEKVFLF